MYVRTFEIARAMKSFILLTLVSVGCLIYLCVSIDLAGIAGAGLSPATSTETDVEDTLTHASASRNELPDGFDLGNGDGPQLVLMKFGAPWCPPCRMVDKELRKLERTSLPVEVRKIDVDERPDMASQYDVSSIPRMILLQDGRKVGDIVGYRSADELSDWIKDSASEQALAGQKRSSAPPAVHANPFFK